MRFTNVNPGEHPEYVIVGIGRPDKKLADSRASVAYKVIDYIDSISLRSSGCKRQLHSALCDKCMLEGVIVFLAKPTVFINNVGMSVSDIMSYYRMRPEQLIIIYDDITVPCGKIRLNYAQDVSFHDGLRSVKRYMHTADFISIGIGVGIPESGEDKSNYLFSDIPKDEYEKVKASFDEVKKAILLIMKYGITATLRAFGKPEAAEQKNQQ